MRSAIFFVLLLLPFSLFASNDANKKRVYFAERANPHVPVIDGHATDEVWQRVEWANDFIQRVPFEGKAPTEQTAFKILYDDKNLYIVIRAFDSHPDEIARYITRRDNFGGDWIEVNIDSYYDHRTAFSFTITAAGVKGDEAVSDDGDNSDANWDPVWFGKVSHDAEGWMAEMRIPFSQLRFAAKEEQVWGLQVQRRLFRKEERSVWQFIPQKTGGWVSYFGELRGLRDIHPPRRIEVLPYTAGDVDRFQKQAGNPFADGQNTTASAGLDAKIGVTSNLTLDVTVNPDFGQVEADPSEINLSAFETFFEEKRPFFVEGQNIMDFRLMAGDGGFSNDRLFYTRRIGRTPHYTPSLKTGEFLDMPESSSIAAAMKLTGKTADGLSIGVLDAITEREYGLIDLNGSRRQVEVEPVTNYFVGRVQKDYNKGNTSFGGIVTATNRNIRSEHLQFLDRAAYTGGIDFRHQWKDKTYYLDIRAAFSHLRGDQKAIQQAQQSSARYFQRPDADYVTYDPERTTLSGHGGYLSFGKGGTSALRYAVGGMWRSPGLELNDVGFMRQADRVLQYAWMGYRITEPFAIFRRLVLNFNQWAGWNFGGETVFSGGNFNGGGQLKNYWQFWFGMGREGNQLSTSALRGGPAMKFPSRWNQWFFLSTDQRRKFYFSANGYTGWADEGGSRERSINLSVSLRPSDAMTLRIGPFFNINKDDLQYMQTSEFAGDSRYLFGRIDQKTLGITMRFNYSVTPTLSLQYYGQPFVSAGRYTDIKRVTNPRAAAYEDRIHRFTGAEILFDGSAYQIDENRDGTADYHINQPNFNFRQFRSNLIVRWEYSPGSTVYLVWAQSRTGFAGDGDFSFRHDLDALFNVYPNNVFLLKINRWFSL